MEGERFAGKHVIVTGAGRGIGRAIARRFAAEGARVLLVGRSRGPLDQTARLIGAAAAIHVADVADAGAVEAAVAAAVAAWGRIDVLVNNAGVEDEAAFLDIEEERWRRVIDTNLTGPFLVSQRVGRAMRDAGGGVILHIASIDSTGGDGPFASYSASKAGLLGLTRTMALELGPLGIRVNAVSPGYTHTEMTERSVGATVMEHLTTDFRRVPLRRLVRPEEIAATCAFLASDDASAITGQNVVVDGGLTANWYVLETLPDD